MAKSKPKSKSKGPKKGGGGGKSRAGKGKKGRKGKGKSKSKKKLGKKKTKKEVTVVDIPPPPPDVYFWVRRQKTSVLIETYEAQTLPDFKIMLGEILGKPVDAFTLFKDDKELVDNKKVEGPKKEKGGRGRGAGGLASRSKSRGSSKGSKKGKKGKKGGKDDPGAEKGSEGPPPEAMKLSDYGINPGSSAIFNPLTLAYVFKDEAGAWEQVDITPWTQPIEIPEVVKQYLRNYENPYTADAPSPDEYTPTEDDSTSKKGGKGRRGK